MDSAMQADADDKPAAGSKSSLKDPLLLMDDDKDLGDEDLLLNMEGYK